MFSGDNRTVAGVATLVLTMGLLAGTAITASAADLGGDCCADLEERVAELEATSVKHGNRKIALTLSGRINEAVLYWNDGKRSDIYVVEGDTQASRVTFEGKGAINADLQAGFLMTIRTNVGRMSKQNQNYVGNDTNMSISDQVVYIDSKSVGKLSIGYGSNSYRSLSAGGIDLGGVSNTNAFNDPAAWTAAFTVGTSTWSKVLSPFTIDRGMNVRYDSASVGGFVVSASWGDDDQASATITFDQKFDTVQLKAGAGINVNNGVVGGVNIGTDADVRYTMAASIHEINSGLFGVVEYNVRQANDDKALKVYEDATNLYLKAGWRQNVTALGFTALYAEWAKSDGVTQKLVGTKVQKAGGTMFGVGVSQDLEDVGAAVYLNYRRLSVDDNGTGTGVVGCGPTSKANCDDIDSVLAGMIVKF
jgi:hypothetical protein